MKLLAAIDPGTAAALIDKASGMDDRWLFIASQVIIICGMGYAIKLLAGFVKDQQAKLNTIVENYSAINQKAIDTIETSNRQGRETTEALREVVQEITFCRNRNQTRPA